MGGERAMNTISMRSMSFWHIYIASYLVVMCFVTASQAVAIGFDHLFCTSAYETVFNQCMRLCGEIDRWNELVQTEQDCDMIAERAIEKLLSLRQEMIAWSKDASVILVVDLEYLLTVVNGLEREILAVCGQELETQTIAITQLFNEIRALIYQRIAQSIT